MHERAPIVSSSSTLLPTPSLLSLAHWKGRRDKPQSHAGQSVCLSVWAAALWPVGRWSVTCRVSCGRSSLARSVASPTVCSPSTAAAAAPGAVGVSVVAEMGRKRGRTTAWTTKTSDPERASQATRCSLLLLTDGRRSDGRTADGVAQHIARWHIEVTQRG